ncbi:MAG: methyltransferase domain-containing protein [Arenicellales bacterium]
MTEQLNMKHKLSGATLIGDRQTWLLEQASGHRVIHIGCVDTGFLDQKLDKDDLLHTQLEGVCSQLVGVDNNSQGIQQLREQGFDKLICGDISDDSTRIIEETGKLMQGCDLIICGEVLEHVLNYGQFLAGIRELALAYKSTVIVSVPNAFSLEGFASVFLGTEDVHPDHKCYFSQVTLTTLLSQAGFSPVGTCFYSRDRVATRIKRITKHFITKTLFAFRPQLAEGLILVVVPEQAGTAAVQDSG